MNESSKTLSNEIERQLITLMGYIEKTRIDSEYDYEFKRKLGNSSFSRGLPKHIIKSSMGGSGNFNVCYYAPKSGSSEHGRVIYSSYYSSNSHNCIWVYIEDKELKTLFFKEAISHFAAFAQHRAKLIAEEDMLKMITNKELDKNNLSFLKDYEKKKLK